MSLTILDDGYYWARFSKIGHPEDGTRHVVLLQDGCWYVIGVEGPVDFNDSHIIYKIPEPNQ